MCEEIASVDGGIRIDERTEYGEWRTSRREILRLAGLTAGGALVAACAPAAPQAASAAPSATATSATASATQAQASAASATPAVGPTPAAAKLMDGFTWFGQSNFRWKGAKVVYIDPGNNPKDGKTPLVTGDLPTADLILVTHAHGDHFSKEGIAMIVGPKTTIVAPADVAAGLTGDIKVAKPGDSLEASGIKIQAVPAYNAGGDNVPHPKKNNWVGYILELAAGTYYHAGDTDNNPELATIRTDAAFLPIGGKFTMPLEDAVVLAQKLKPKVVVPMHYGYAAHPTLGLVGVEGDGPRFKAAAVGIDVMVFTPLVPFNNK